MLRAVPVIDYYGAKGWGGRPAADLLPRQVVARDLIARALTGLPGGTVLDVGCGDGSFLDTVATHVGNPALHWIGVDYSDHQLAKAAALPHEFHRCDLDQGIPLPDASADLVYATEVIEHLTDPDLLVDECARVLRPGGRLVLTTPNLHAWFNRLLFPAGIQPVFYETSSRSTAVGAGPLRALKQDTLPVGHLRLFNRRALLDLVAQSGLRPELVRGARFHAVPRPLWWLDGLLSRRASLASILVLQATKPH
ncbi:hypothetical protein Sya03_51770 [Spirilliplanes yamanashiensis]|uniref:Methyltransferase n=1 Tax=Spirilliplanes yamanashiensis TaxID=42233 RepID=A0A8J3YD84_9ACTN|nr:hypothetical protein Sya03_51770 [Spirilliplanes yamanashiensis]